MSLNSRKVAFAAGVLILLGALFLLVLRRPATETAQPEHGIYYTGPKRASWNPNVWVDDNHRAVPVPAGEPATSPPPVHRSAGGFRLNLNRPAPGR